MRCRRPLPISCAAAVGVRSACLNSLEPFSIDFIFANDEGTAVVAAAPPPVLSSHITLFLPMFFFLPLNQTKGGPNCSLLAFFSLPPLWTWRKNNLKKKRLKRRSTRWLSPSRNTPCFTPYHTALSSSSVSDHFGGMLSHYRIYSRIHVHRVGDIRVLPGHKKIIYPHVALCISTTVLSLRHA